MPESLRPTPGDGRALNPHLVPGLREYLNEDEHAEGRLEAHALIEDAVAVRASDIHLDPEPHGYRIRLRIDGLMVDATTLESGLGELLSNQLKTLASLDPMPTLNSAEGSFAWRGEDTGHLDLRVTTVPCVNGDKLSVRILAEPDAFQDLSDLGLPEQEVEAIRQWTQTAGGVLLVTGPTGSGKTTTLYALLHEIGQTSQQIITLEDPVEYAIPGVNQIQINTDQGLDFEQGTQTLLRLDPDYVLVGEVRDGPSARGAINIATSGRSLMATLHSRDAVGTVASLRNMGLEDFEIAPTLELVIAQRLVRRLCPHCHEHRAPNDREQKWLGIGGRETPETVWAARGCSVCNNLGYYGRIGIFEVWHLDESDSAAILDHHDDRGLRQRLADKGQRMLLDDGMDKAERGLTTYDELFRAGLLSP
ncbi:MULTISPECIES: GspE/PulE family protein [unclassified Thioalkalivibrio]|uniref:GspE/PulE family protein n=1 Tax=unclassified Thioalkalivibrio TaxID=2621013 RepID=UPI00036EF949|nr:MULTISPECIES: GspE/PulE family protein [unclassified Thioalkalivibrio]